jgi:hypothetical protein
MPGFLRRYRFSAVFVLQTKKQRRAFGPAFKTVWQVRWITAWDWACIR